MIECPRCHGKKRVNADIPLWAVPDVNNCSFTEECPICKGIGYLTKKEFEELT